MIKKLSKRLLCLNLLLSQINLNAEFIKINKDNIEKAKINLQKEEFNKKIILTGGSILVTGLAGIYIWNFFKPQSELEANLKKVSNFIDKQANNKQESNTQANNKQESNKQESNTQEKVEKNEDKWLKYGLKFCKSTLPSFAFELTKIVLFNKLSEVLSRSLPSASKISDKLFSNKNISWFVKYKTSLLENIKSINNNIDKIISEKKIDKELIESDYNILVSQIEKILGFMLYNTSFLEKDSKAEIDRSLLIQKRTVTILLEFLNLIKKLDKIDYEYTKNLKKTLLRLIENIESFNQIDQALGLSDEYDRPIFGKIKKILYSQDNKNEQEIIGLDIIKKLFEQSENLDNLNLSNLNLDNLNLDNLK